MASSPVRAQVKALCAAGADPKRARHDGKTAHAWAVHKGRQPVAAALEELFPEFVGAAAATAATANPEGAGSFVLE